MACVQVLVLFPGCYVVAVHGWFVGASVYAMVCAVRGNARPLVLSACVTGQVCDDGVTLRSITTRVAPRDRTQMVVITTDAADHLRPALWLSNPLCT